MTKLMKRTDEQWQKAFAKRLRTIIEEKGYTSAYEFWLQECGEDISRSNLDNILNGRVDPKISTLQKLAISLGMTLQELLDSPNL
ncbi:MAG: helix-turn-helix transcriptional regulator [Bacteriovoracaceae bacterium]|nr:helix-turn-helix transcriptional regulator [Bacteriovoracaceae bacterium]